MKKNLIYLILFVLLLAIAAWLVTRDRSISLDPKDVSFRVADSAAVNRIFMADRKGNKVLLTRQEDGNWLVNKKHLARPDMMKVLMETITRMEVKMPVPKGAINTVKANIATAGIKVEVYSGLKSKKELVFYVGSSTIDTRGTYMIKENADLPYILYMPGWEGYLTPRFFTSEEQWRERVLFRLDPNEVARFEVQYPDTPAYDFAIERQNDSSYVLIDPMNNSRQAFNPTAGKAIWKDFAVFRIEGFENETPWRDSVINMVPPVFHATITERSGKVHFITTYFKSQLNTIDVVLMQGFPDLDRNYFYYREGQEFGVLQHLVTPWFFMNKAEIIERGNR